MDLNNLSMKKIRELIVFTAFLVIALWKFDIVIDVIKTIWDILSPFALGGAIAFVINVPMSFLEKKLFGKAKEKGTKAAEKFARPISLLLTLTGIVVLLILVMFGVIPAYQDHRNSNHKHHCFYSSDASLDPGIFTQ